MHEQQTPDFGIISGAVSIATFLATFSMEQYDVIVRITAGIVAIIAGFVSIWYNIKKNRP